MGPINPYRAAQSERLKALLQGNYAPNPQEQRNEIFGAPPVQYPEFIENIGSAANNFLSPVDYETGMPDVDVAGPVMVGPTGAKNAQKLLKMMQAYNKHGTGHEKLASNAVTFLKYKYPTIYKKIKSLGGQFGLADKDDAGSLGAYFGDIKSPVIFDKGNLRRLNEYINTGAHELGHFVRHARGKLDELVEADKFGWVEDLKTGQNRFVEGSYHPSELPLEVTSSIKDPAVLNTRKLIQGIKYYDQPAEVAARQAGQTGENAYNNFIKNFFHPDEAYTFAVMDKLGIPHKERYKFTPPTVK